MGIEFLAVLLGGAFAGEVINGLAGFGTALFALGFWLQVLPAAQAVAMVVVMSVVSGLQGLWIVRGEIRRNPGRLARFWHWLTGRHGSPELANPRLEALRRAAVLSWHYGFSVPGRDVADFLSAGFSLEQYELMVLRIGAAIRSPAKRIAA